MKHLHSPALRRAGALVIATAITSTTLLSAAVPAQAHPAGDRTVSASASWLTSQLTDGFLVGEFGPQYGPSIDAALSLAEAGHQGGVAAVDTALRGAINGYISGGAFDAGSTYAGPTGKAATLALVAGADPRSYGGVDLISRLEAVVSTAPPTTGRIEDVSSYGDYANVIGQSFAARALTTVGSDLADEATSFLLEQQCGAGFFRFGLNSDKSSPRQDCVTGAAGSASDLDATAIAVINLLATPNASPAATAAARSGASWLETQQSADGSFGAGSDDGANANTTGLAGWALGEAGKTSAAKAAAGWLRSVQIADLAPCATTLSAENGALAPSRAALDATRASGGIASGQRISYAFATAQALPALAYVPEGSGALGISAPATAVENSTVTLTVTGLGSGEPACVSFGGQAKQVTGTGAVLSTTFQLPAGVATHTFRLTTLGGSRTAATSATATPTPALVPQVGALDTKRVVKVRRNRFAVSVVCDGTTACAGALKVRTARKVAVRSGKRVVTLAKREYSVAAGGEKRLVLKLTRAGRAVLVDGKVKVKAVQKAPGAERAVTTFWLKRA